MSLALTEYLTAQFYAWEERGRGWKVFGEPVELESEFIPFFGHRRPKVKTEIDDGRRPRFFPKFQERLGLFKKPTTTSYGEEAFQKLEELYPIHALKYDNTNPVTEFQVNFDKDTRVLFDSVEQLLLMLSTCEGIVGFEIFGTKEKITIQFVSTGSNSHTFKSYISAYIPGVVIHENRQGLHSALNFTQPASLIDLALRDEFMRPLKTWNKFDPDPMAGCIAVLESIGASEFGMLQVLFQGAVNPWVDSAYRAITDGSGDPFFANSAEMLPLAKEKFASPLFAAVIRTLGQAPTDDRATAIAAELSQSLISISRSGSNTLIPLSGEPSCDIEDILFRRSRRIGMLLNSGELASVVHIPDRSVISSKLRSYVGKTKKAPEEVLGHSFELGNNTHLGQETKVTLSNQHRLRHMHVIGATGTGKSSLLLKSISQDIEQGRGLTVLDPHGDLIDEVISHIPENRFKDVILVDPSDSEYPIGLNLLSAYSDPERVILSSDLVALFRRFATSWGDQMTSVLANAINTILESKDGGTLIDLRRLLVETSFRSSFLKTVDDPNIQYYWKNEFQLLRKNTVAPILTRLDTFLRPRTIRNMMAQKEGLDFNDILASGKILLIKLAQGLIGEENSYLLGTLFVAKLHQAAQARQNLAIEDRKPFYFYIDEFQNFITPSMSAILSGARKYGLGLILAHQDLDQLTRRDSELANSVISNPAIRICFRCGDRDALKLEEGFSYFDSTDLQSLGVGQAIVRVNRKDHDFNLNFCLIPKIDSAIGENTKQLIGEHCRKEYALHQSQVEDILKEALQIESGVVKPEKNRKTTEKVEEPVLETIKPIEKEQKPEVDLTIQAKQFINKEVEKEERREHRFIQEYVKKIAEARNFKAVLEEPVNDHTGNIDVSLLKDDLRIACEISVKNTVEYEVQNIEKCFTAGYELVFMISNDSKHLGAIRTKAISAIPESLHRRLFFVSKDEFVNQLDLFLAQKSQPMETRVKGYRVKLNYTETSNLEGKEKAIKDIVLSSLRRRNIEDEGVK